MFICKMGHLPCIKRIKPNFPPQGGSSPPADPRHSRYSLKTQCKPPTLPFHQSGTRWVRRRPAALSFLEESTGIDGLRSDTQVSLFSSFRNTMSACSVGTETGRSFEPLRWWVSIPDSRTTKAWLGLTSQPTEKEITTYSFLP